MKLDVTPAQLRVIKEMADNVSAAFANAFDEELAKESQRQVLMVDAMLKRNNLPPRDFS